MEALYLKYRPQTLDELIGQETVKKVLSQAYKNGKLSHAYLLVGPRGTGKTSTARILAKMVNCELVQSFELAMNIPCNKCPTCMSITDGSNLDLIEIDAASNRGIDDIRSLRENIKLSPSGGKKKVYIIDEVHMLTTEAFNALLKTLEEPPAHVLFILATTEVSKVPQTILSRVQRLNFKLATTDDLLETLTRIVKKEKMEIEKEALRVLAKCAEGSFRDGVKLLDQVSGLGRKITLQDITDHLKSAKFDDLVELLNKLANHQAKEAILEVNKQLAAGIDIKGVTLSLMEMMRALLLIKNDLGSQLIAPEFGSDRYMELQELSKKFEVKDLSRGLDSLQEALEKLKFASIPSLPLELAIIEVCTPINVMRNEAKRSEESPKTETLKQVFDREAQTESVGGDGQEIVLLHEKWTFVLETIRPYNFSLEALLRSVKIAQCLDGVVTLEVPYSFHQRILETSKSKDMLESVLSDVLGKPTKVITVLGQRPMRVEDVANVEIAADDEIIRAASEIFEGSLVD